MRFLAALQLAGGDQGQTAAHRTARQHDLVPGGFQHRDRGAAHLWRKVIGEAVRPQQDRAARVRAGSRLGAARRSNHDVNVCSANAGTSRSGAMPPSRFASAVPAIRLTSRGAFDAIRDNCGSQPIDQCDSGRAHGRRA